MKLLITGGCGFLGANLSNFYLGQGAEVVIADALFRTGGEKNLEWLKTGSSDSGKLHFHRCDLANDSEIDSIFRRHAPFDFVCHVGGQVAMTTSLADPRRDFLTNVHGTFNVLEAVRHYSPDSLVAYSSTNKVYGDLDYLNYEERKTRYVVPEFPYGFGETLPLDFSTPYGCSKGAADQYVRDWCRIYGVKTVVFRHSSIYGGRQYATVDQGWIGWFCKKALEQKLASEENRPIDAFMVSGTGKQVRDVLHVDNLIHLYDSAYQKRAAVAGEIFNIGGGMDNSLSLLELFTLLGKILKLKHALSFADGPRRKSDQNVFVADIAKVRKMLSWTPKISCEEGIKRTLGWMQEDPNAGYGGSGAIA